MPPPKPISTPRFSAASSTAGLGMGVLCPPGFVPSPLLVQLMLTHDQQQPMAADSSQNSYEQYIQNYAAQQVLTKWERKIFTI